MVSFKQGLKRVQGSYMLRLTLKLQWKHVLTNYILFLATVMLTGTPINYLRSVAAIMVRKVFFFFSYSLKKYIHSLILIFKNEDFENEPLVCLAKCYCRAAHQLLAWRSFPTHQRGVGVKDPHSQINHRNKT